MAAAGQLAAALAAAMSALVTTKATPSVSVAIVQHDRIAFSSAVGRSDIAAQRSATQSTLYRIGSITKVFTALSILQLVEQRKLSLDETLASFEPSFPNASQITIRDLLDHRSGIPDYLDAAIASGHFMHPTTPEAIVELASHLTPESAPGTRYSYSNTNYVLLGVIVQHVSGLPLATYYERNLFERAGMHATFAGENLSGPNVAVGYDLSTGTTPQNAGDISWYFGCGDISSTADDLARFDIALMQGRLVGPATLHEMAADALPTGTLDQNYGLGTMTFPLGSVLLQGHHGGLPGFESDDEMIVRDGFAVIALGNDYQFPTRAIMNVALRTAYPADYAASAAQQQAARERQGAEAAPLTARFTAFFEDVVAGRVPTQNLSTALAGALTPPSVAAMAQRLATNGTFEHLDFAGEDTVGPYTRYHYTALFTHASLPVMFVLDGSGALAGFFM